MRDAADTYCSGKQPELETGRLRVVALTPRQMVWWLTNLSRLEREMGCTYRGEPLTGRFREIVAWQAERACRDETNFMWHGFWFIVRKEDRAVVGSADFKDVPNDRGEVEIGYGLGRAFEGNGYMTEAVRAMCAWAKEQPGVRRILAETELDGLASQRVLKRCGFRERERGETVWWSLSNELG